MSFSLGLLIGALSAIVAALPAALRVPESLSAWAVLAGSGALLLGPAFAGLTLRRPLALPARALLAGLGLAALPLALLAAKLKAVTHHRPLGAVTFAIGALLVIATTTAVVLRVLQTLRSSELTARRARGTRAILLTLSALGPLSLLLRAIATPGARSAVFDVSSSLGVGAILLLLRWPASLERIASKLGVIVWSATIVVGVVAFATGPGRHAAEVASPALFAPLGWLLPR